MKNGPAWSVDSTRSAICGACLFVLATMSAGCGGGVSALSDAATVADAASAGGADAAKAVDAGVAIDSSAGADAAAGSATDPKRLPIGDGKWGSTPKVGYIYSCQTSFNGMGSKVNGPWIKSDGTFDDTAKVAVQGSIAWPAHSFAATVTGNTRTLTGNGLPSHDTGLFPIQASDPAHAYDGNPNSIKAQTLSYSLPSLPAVAASPTCLGGGPIGVMLTGAAFFDALDAVGRDAEAHEEQDSCQGHPEMSGQYHYHSLSACIADPGTGHSALVGYALDGFGIYGTRGENGETLTDADLDECHGHTHMIDWDGTMTSLYHYHATLEYPYTLGCYRGTPTK